MPPPKKAGKKSAKKAVGHHHDDHHQTNDLRRAYEHMGRVAVLRQALQSLASDAIADLTALAQQAIKHGHSKDAADLLRTSEHFSFAVLAGEVSDFAGTGRISADLKASIKEHFDELSRRADEHWEEKEDHPKTLIWIYERCRKGASQAFKAQEYHRALEFARAAEALTHVRQHGSLKLESGHKSLQLKSA